MYSPKSYILTFHHSHQRWRVLLRGSVRFLGRYNHSKCMHWYTRNLKIKSQTHSQIKKKLSNWPSRKALMWRYVSTDLHSTLPKLSMPCYLLAWPLSFILLWILCQLAVLVITKILDSVSWKAVYIFRLLNQWTVLERYLSNNLENNKFIQHNFFYITIRISRDIWEALSLMV